MQPEEFIGQIEEPRRSDIRRIHELIRSTAPELTPVVAGKMLGYGPYHYKYATGREGDTTVLSLANNKNYMSLYVFCADEHGYLAERYRDVLPKADIGKSSRPDQEARRRRRGCPARADRGSGCHGRRRRGPVAAIHRPPAG